jgi:hypothetical protein
MYNSYDPKKHLNVDIYMMVSKKFSGGIATVYEKVEDEAVLKYAEKHPQTFLVKDKKE